jgi:7,8-dihydropterin-6-yl-methyl-4-(beta-D-ribofuranosyl)aminobenzene 5'-phosphate synthase
MGGFHLQEMSADRILEVVARLRAQGVRRVGPCHCTGDLARRLFREEYGMGFLEVGVGRIIKIGTGAD